MTLYHELNPSQLDFSKVPVKQRELRIKQFRDWKAGNLEPPIADAYHQWLEAAIDREEVTFVGPGLIRKAANLSKAVVAQALAPIKMVDPSVKADRLAQCSKNLCGMFDAALTKCKHPKCGCGLVTKAGWSTQQCPVNLWKE